MALPPEFNHKACHNRVRYEELILKVADVFVTQADYARALEQVCALVGDGAKVSRAYIFENFDNNQRTCNTVEWVAEGIEPVKDTLQDVSFEDMPYWRICCERHEIIGAESIEALPEVIYETLKAQDIQSILVVPLFQFDRWHGFVGFDVCDHRREWNREDTWLLETTAKMISAALGRHQTELQMAHTSRLSAIGALAAGVAHEFNNLNSGIQGLVELAVETPEIPAEVAEDMGKVLSLVNRGTNLTSRLLGIAQRTPESAPIDPMTVLDDLLGLLARKMEKQHIEVQVHRCVGTPLIRADRAELAQLFLQILVNAMEALECVSSRRLVIAVSKTPTSMMFSFQDTGPGLPDQVLDDIFLPFFSLRGKLGGGNTPNAGLGLTLAAQIVNSLGGQIRIDNRPSGGAEVRFDLPTQATKAVDKLNRFAYRRHD